MKQLNKQSNKQLILKFLQSHWGVSLGEMLRLDVCWMYKFSSRVAELRANTDNNRHLIYCDKGDTPSKNRYYYLGYWRNAEYAYGLKAHSIRARKKYIELKKAGLI